VALDSFAASDLRAVVSAYRNALDDNRETLNDLNVYPVPDGDTGTNMALTLGSVVEDLDSADGGLEGTCKAIAHGSLMGARGNSGVIMSQILRGFVGVAEARGEIDGPVFAEALAAAAQGAYTAVGNPVEGTILTVAREASEAALHAAAAGGNLLAVLEAARCEGDASLKRTPTLLPALAEAGVVDAGGLGLLLLLDAALWIADERPVPAPDVAVPAKRRAQSGEQPQHASGLLQAQTPQAHAAAQGAVASAVDGAGSDISELRYEVMFLLDAPDESIEGFKAAWAEVGDSIVVVGGDGLFNCHIHCDDIGAAIECGIEVGRPHEIRVTDLMDQLAEQAAARHAPEQQADEAAADTEPDPDEPPVPTAVVAVGAGAGMARILRSMGVRAVVAGGQTMNPSTADLLAAVEAANAEAVVILPNNKNIIGVAEQVDSQTPRSVRVVPTRSIPEALSCLMSYDPFSSVDDNAGAMTEAIAAVTTGEVTQAVRDAVSDAGPVAEGDWLGLSRNGIVAVAKSSVEAAISLLDQTLDSDHELLTVIVGADADPGETAVLAAWLEQRHPGLEVDTQQGDQPLYPYLFGAE